MNALAGDFHRLRIQIDHEVARRDDRLRMTLRTAHDRMNTCDQLVLVERLGHVVVGTEAQTTNLVLDAGHAGKDKDRRLHLGQTQGAKNFITRHIRQVQVQQDDVVII